jgi:hypothetical protein
MSDEYLTLEAAAERAGVRESTLLYWVNCRWLPTHDRGLRYSEVLRASLIQLQVFGEMEPPDDRVVRPVRSTGVTFSG